MTTTDISKFGAREREMLIELLTAWNKQGLPDDFYDDKVTAMFNKKSGCVFLTNSEYETAMMNGDTLESFYTTPYDGIEGFKDDLRNEFLSNIENWHDDDIEYLKDIGAITEEEFNEYASIQI